MSDLRGTPSAGLPADGIEPGPEYRGPTERTSHAVTVSASPSGNGKAAGAIATGRK
ncbi:hypothetical protein [Streptomyces sp. NPDC088794]|uniref:hypothetical protein n=1 Tax=Streptomyces sp. NPDC088794 TaxID=3365902 RepID=UPI00381932F3